MISQESVLKPEALALLDESKCASEKDILVPETFDWI